MMTKKSYPISMFWVSRDDLSLHFVIIENMTSRKFYLILYQILVILDNFHAEIDIQEYQSNY